MFPEKAHNLIHSPGHAAASDAQAMPRLDRGQLHEIHAEASALAAAMAFAFSDITRSDTARNGPTRAPILLVRYARRPATAAPLTPCGEGLAALGIDPARLVIVEARDGLGLLQAGLEAARCPALAAVVLETWGRLPEYNLTASRRLVLAAETTRLPVIVLRGDAEPRASAAHSRWHLRAAASRPPVNAITPVTAELTAKLPGAAAIELTLLRRRGGPADLRWRLEWDDTYGYFREAPASQSRNARAPSPIHATPLFGAVVSLARHHARAAGHAGAADSGGHIATARAA